MAINESPWVIQADSYSAEVFRREAQSGITGTGIVASTDLAVTANGTPNMSVNVAAGEAIIPGTLGGSSAGMQGNTTAQTAYSLPSSFTQQGCYYAWNNASVNVAISAANATNPRIDIIYIDVADAQYSGSTNAGAIGVQTGTPAATPAAPAAPANSVVLAQVYVGANVTTIVSGNITDERPVLSGSIPVTLFASTARPTANRAGHLNFDTDKANLVVWNGSTWALPILGGLGVENISGSSYNTAGTLPGAIAAGTTLKAQFYQGGLTAASGGTLVSFPVAYTSWCICVAIPTAVVGTFTNAFVSSCTTSGPTVKIYNGSTQATSGSYTVTILAIGV